MIKTSGRNTHSYFEDTDNESEHDGRRESTNHGNDAYRGDHRTGDVHHYQHQPNILDSSKSEFDTRSYPVDKDHDIMN